MAVELQQNIFIALVPGAVVVVQQSALLPSVSIIPPKSTVFMLEKNSNKRFGPLLWALKPSMTQIVGSNLFLLHQIHEAFLYSVYSEQFLETVKVKLKHFKVQLFQVDSFIELAIWIKSSTKIYVKFCLKCCKITFQRL